MSRVAAIVTAVTVGIAGGLSGATLAAAAPAAPAAISAPAAVAANGGDFNPGYIIDDSKFFEPNAMSVGDIQAFLNGKVSNCAAGYTCLKDYSESTRSIDATPMCSAYQGAGNESAATIIWKIAQACGISPKVLLVTLQKEQGLVTSTAPSSYAYRSAMGAGCPDTAACDSNYYGFFNQVQYGAYLLKRYTQPPGTGPGTAYTTRFDLRYPVGQTTAVLYNPNGSCGTSPVNIANQATHALYIYTPYQPNPAALSNLYGTGDGCSTYGNRNFWRYYTDWFGPTTGNDQPVGGLDTVSSSVAGVSVAGWSFDPNSHDPINVQINVDGNAASNVRADGSRGDILAVFPTASPNVGYSTTLDLPDGDHTICVYGVNVGPGANALIGCRTVTVDRVNPRGYVDSVSLNGTGIAVSGWAFDPNSTASITVQASLDGQPATTSIADLARGDVHAAFPGQGVSTGFSLLIPAAPATHQICLTGVNVGPGADTQFDCRTVVVPTQVPRGNIDALGPVGGGVQVSGWAYDPSTQAPVWLHVYVDGRFATGLYADGSRPDVGAVFPGAGALHGFSSRVAVADGTHTVCVYALNVQSDRSLALGCRTVDVGQTSPLGNLDGATGGAGVVAVSGWTFDPESTAITWTHIYIDGRFATGLPAAQARADVAAVYPSAGGARGFAGSIAASPGSHTVCAYGLSADSARSSALGCRSIVVN